MPRLNISIPTSQWAPAFTRRNTEQSDSDWINYQQISVLHRAVGHWTRLIGSLSHGHTHKHTKSPTAPVFRPIIIGCGGPVLFRRIFFWVYIHLSYGGELTSQQTQSVWENKGRLRLRMKVESISVSIWNMQIFGGDFQKGSEERFFSVYYPIRKKVFREYLRIWYPIWALIQSKSIWSIRICS